MKWIIIVIFAACLILLSQNGRAVFSTTDMINGSTLLTINNSENLTFAVKVIPNSSIGNITYNITTFYTNMSKGKPANFTRGNTCDGNANHDLITQDDNFYYIGDNTDFKVYVYYRTNRTCAYDFGYPYTIFNKASYQISIYNGYLYMSQLNGYISKMWINGTRKSGLNVGGSPSGFYFVNDSMYCIQRPGEDLHGYYLSNFSEMGTGNTLTADIVYFSQYGDLIYAHATNGTYIPGYATSSGFINEKGGDVSMYPGAYQGNYINATHVIMVNGSANEYVYDYSSYEHEITGGIYADNLANSRNKTYLTWYSNNCQMTGGYCYITGFIGNGLRNLTVKNINYTYWKNTINVIFDSTSNATVLHSGGGYSDDVNNITDGNTTFGDGKVSIYFGNQLIEFIYTTNMTFNQNVHVSSLPDKAQKFSTWGAYRPIEDANVYIFEIDNTTANKYSLIWSGFTDNAGVMYATLVSGKTYKVQINHSDYSPYTAFKYVIPGVTDEISMNIGEIVGNIYARYSFGSNCPSLIVNRTAICIFTAWSTSIYTTGYVNYSVNDGSVSRVNCTPALPMYGQICNITFTISNYYRNVKINTSFTTAGRTNTYTLNYTYYALPGEEYTYSPLSGFVIGDNFVIVAFMIVVMSAGLAGVANMIQPGTGIFVYGTVLSLFSSVIGAFYISGVVVGLLGMLYVARRLL